MKANLPASRRRFLTKSLAAGAGIMVGPNMIFAAKSATPGAKVNLACCGIGNRGAEITLALAATGLANVVALCDTDIGAKHTEKVLKKFPKAKRFRDFREMFDKMGNEIEAVSIGTPDFSHFPIHPLHED